MRNLVNDRHPWRNLGVWWALCLTVGPGLAVTFKELIS